MRRIPFYIIGSLLLVVLQTTAMKFLAIGEVVPDIVVIWIVYIAVKEGQLSATVAGFLLGLVLDLMSGQDGMLGLSALAKTIAGFIAGYFYNENKTFQTLGGWRFISAIGVAALLHNVVYFIIFLQGTPIGLMAAILFYGIPAAVYTTVVGLLPMFVFSRKYLT